MWDYYDSMYKVEKGLRDLKWTERNTISVGVNYFPIRDIVVKGEYSIGLLKKPFNNEPSVSIGIAYSGWFM